MYGGILIVAAMALIALSPAIWVAWWLIADLGEKASGKPRQSRYETPETRLRRAA